MRPAYRNRHPANPDSNRIARKETTGVQCFNRCALVEAKFLQASAFADVKRGPIDARNLGSLIQRKLIKSQGNQPINFYLRLIINIGEK
jgi:hypothetical protein